MDYVSSAIDMSVILNNIASEAFMGALHVVVMRGNEAND